MEPKKLEPKTPSVISSTALHYSEKEVAFVLRVLGFVEVEQGLAREVPGHHRLELIYQEDIFRLLSRAAFRQSEEIHVMSEYSLARLLVGMLHDFENYCVEEAILRIPCQKTRRRELVNDPNEPYCSNETSA